MDNEQKDFYVENLHTNCEDKKPQGLRPTNLNSLVEIKLYRFSLPLFPEVLL